MTYKTVLYTLLLSAVILSAPLNAAPSFKPDQSIPANPVATKAVAIDFKYKFKMKGFDAEDHGAFLGRATKMIMLPSGAGGGKLAYYDGDVALNPKWSNTTVSVSRGPDVILPNGKTVGQLKFGSFRMLFDNKTETVILMSNTLILQDAEGRSLTIFPN